MAYDASNLSALTYANGFTLWHYRTSDAAAADATTAFAFVVGTRVAARARS